MLLPRLASATTTVHVAARVTDPAISCTLAISASAGGSTSSLSGKGNDNAQCIGAPGHPSLECIWSLSGSVSGTVVTLSGTVIQSSDHNGEVGTSITLVADASTGAVTWTFDGLTFTGIGTVVIT